MPRAYRWAGTGVIADVVAKLPSDAGAPYPFRHDLHTPERTSMTSHPAAVAALDAMFPAHVIVVTGKGGVGKTTTAATLGVALASVGRSTLLVEVEGRDSLSRALGTAPWDYQEREFRPGIWGTSLDATQSVLEYLELFYGLKRLQWALERSNALDFVTAAAPGLRDLLLIGKVYETEARREADGRRRYDTIIIDAPPTGRIVPFLQSPAGVTEIVRVGPIKRQAAQITAMLTDPRRTQVVIVALPEEMPVTETVAGAMALQEAGLRVGPIIANRVEPDIMSQADANLLTRVGRSRLAEIAGTVGITWTQRDVDALRRVGVDHRDRLDHQARMQACLATIPDATSVALTQHDSGPPAALPFALAEQLSQQAMALRGPT